MIAVAIALACLLALALMIWGTVIAARRDAAAKAHAEEIERANKALIKREAIEDAISDDPNLAGRAVKWVRPDRK